MNNLSLLTGADIPFPEGRLVIHQPTIKEIGFIGENTFFLGCGFLSFSKDILNDDHEILYNTEIKGFGEILSGNELVGTFESFSIGSDKRLKMNMFQSIVNLSDIENIRLKFFAFKKFVLNIIINSDIDPISNENGLITIDKIESADNEEIPKNIIELKDLSAFDSVEELLLNRRKLIKIEEENIYDDDDIDDFFD